MTCCSNICMLWMRNHQLLSLLHSSRWSWISTQCLSGRRQARILLVFSTTLIYWDAWISELAQASKSKSRKSTKNDQHFTKKCLPNRSTSLIANTSGTTSNCVLCKTEKHMHVLALRPCLVTRWLQQSKITTNHLKSGQWKSIWNGSILLKPLSRRARGWHASRWRRLMFLQRGVSVHLSVKLQPATW